MRMIMLVVLFLTACGSGMGEAEPGKNCGLHNYDQVVTRHVSDAGLDN
jgi:hypothetical protein